MGTSTDGTRSGDMRPSSKIDKIFETVFQIDKQINAGNNYNFKSNL